MPAGAASMPRLSIIIPVLNEAPLITGTLAGLQTLRNRGHEIICVDGGSEDDTGELARPYVDRLLVTAPGRARQMNAGAAACGGDVLLFLHADTLLPANADRELLAGLRDSGRHWGRFDVRLSGGQAAFRIIERAMNLRSRWTGIATGDQAIFIERSLWERIGGYPDIPLMEDVALSKALKAHGPPLCLRRRVVAASRRWERHGVVRTVLTMWCLRAAFALGVDPDRLRRAYD